MSESRQDNVRFEWGCILKGRQPEVLRINGGAAEKNMTLLHQALSSFSFYCLTEMIWQSLKINELYSFFLQSFALKAFYKEKEKEKLTQAI